MRRNWFIAAVVIGVAAIVIAAVVMRLTEDESPSTAEWAEAVCKDIGDWRDSITSLADVSGETLTPELLRESLRRRRVHVDARRRSSRPRSSRPRSGEDLEEQFEQVGTLESSFDDLTEAADDAADASAGEFLQELAGLATQFSAFDGAPVVGRDAPEREHRRGVEGRASAGVRRRPSCQSLQADS